MKTKLITSLIAAAAIAVGAAPAQGAVTIGSNLGGAANSNSCGGTDCTTTNLTLTNNLAPGGLRSPVNGTVTSWRFKSGSAGNTVSLRVMSPVDALTFTGRGASIPVTSDNGLNGPFATSVPVRAGDAIGLNRSNGALVLSNNPAANQVYWTMPLLADGETRAGTQTNGLELLVQATIEPSNTLGFGKQVKNTKKGTAQLTLDVPNAGELSIAGKGVKVAGGATRTLSGPTTLALTLKAKGAQARALRENGKVKLKPSFTFTPDQGATNAQTTKVKLARG